MALHSPDAYIANHHHRLHTGAIEEAQVAVESGCASSELDYSLLGGHWLLRYTTASDVVGVLGFIFACIHATY